MSKIMDHYIDRLMLIEELKSLGQDFIDAEVDIKTMAGLTAAIRHVKNFPAADIKPETRWIPVTPETMPPETEGVSDDLVIRAMLEGRGVIFVGFTRHGKWYTAMAHNSDILNGNIAVTHWMYAETLLGGVDNG